MLSGMRTRMDEGTQEHAHEQVQQRRTHFQGLGNDSLTHGTIMSYEALDEEFCPPATGYKIDRETVLLPSGFKSESESLDWDAFFRINSPINSSSDSDCSQDTMVPSVFGNLLDIDTTNLGAPLPKREPVGNPEHIAVTGDSVTSARKRSSDDAFSTESVESDGRAKQKAKTDADKHEKTRIQYACPFQKLDPVKHHECLKYALHRIKDVKQHVYRRHKQPDYYCARCFVVFPTADDRDDHARSKDCDNKKASPFEGITDVEKCKLNKSPSRGLDAEEQWFTMWEIIFPGKQKPSSVFVGSYIEEMVPVLRSLWTRNNSNILAKAQRDQTSQVDLALLDAVVKLIFDSLEAEASTSLTHETGVDSSQTEYSLTEGDSPIITQPYTIAESPDLLYQAQPYFPDDANGEPEPAFHIESHIAFGEG